MVTVPTDLRVAVEFHEGLEADDDLPATRGGWFLCITSGSQSGLYIGPEPDFPADGYETPGQAVDALAKWAGDRKMDIQELFIIRCDGRTLDGRG